MSSAQFTGANPPRKVAEYTSLADYETAQGNGLHEMLRPQFQPGDRLMVLENNGKQWTELWRGGARVGTFS
jgi:hypothetical protein